MYVVRLNANGTLDSGFGPLSGKKIFYATGSQRAARVQIDGTGKIMVYGYGNNNSTSSSSSGSLFHRLLSNGNEDNTFNSSGYVGYPWAGYTTAFALGTGGQSYIASNYSRKTRLHRINPNGSATGELGQNSPFDVPVSQYDEPAKIELYGNAVYIMGTAQPTSNVSDDELYILKIINVAGVTATQEQPVNFSFSPNPVTDRLTLNFTEGGIQTLKICNLTGQEVLQQRVNNSQTEVDVSPLTKGLYLLTVETSDGRRGVQKFVKN
jgi:hypothetical protein